MTAPDSRDPRDPRRPDAPASEAEAPAKRLDVRGYLCPIPARLSEQAIQDLHPGDHLEIVGDDPVMVIDIPAWCEWRSDPTTPDPEPPASLTAPPAPARNSPPDSRPERSPR